MDLVNINALAKNQIADRSISICLPTKLEPFFMWVGASASTNCENRESNDASGLKRLSNGGILGAPASRRHGLGMAGELILKALPARRR